MVSLAISDVTINFFYGGGQVISSELYLGLNDRYNECYPINIIEKEKVINKPFNKLALFLFKNRDLRRIISYILRSAKLVDFFSMILIRKFKPVDILISNNDMDYILSKKLSFKNLIIIKHTSSDVLTQEGELYLKKIRFLIKKSNKYKIVVLNKKDYIDLARIFGRDRIKLIYNGILYKDNIPLVNLSNFIKVDFTNKLIILYLGRLDESQKQISKLILSASKIRNKDFIIIIAGTGPYKDYYVKLAESQGLSDKIIFTGFVTEDVKISLYKIADVFVQPSQNESFGLTTLEAMHYGDILLTTKNKGSVEIINDKIDGLFIKADPTDIAEKINWIASLKESERDTLKQNAIKKSNYFNYNKMLSEYIKLIEELAN